MTVIIRVSDTQYVFIRICSWRRLRWALQGAVEPFPPILLQPLSLTHLALTPLDKAMLWC